MEEWPTRQEYRKDSFDVCLREGEDLPCVRQG